MNFLILVVDDTAVMTLCVSIIRGGEHGDGGFGGDDLSRFGVVA